MDHPIDSDFGINKLKDEGYDTILLAAGTSASKRLPVENADLDGIYLELEFLQSAKLSREPQLEAPVGLPCGLRPHRLRFGPVRG